MEPTAAPLHFDVLIIGAGLSGIGAAWHLQQRCPSKCFTILEARAQLGGTWDLFRYPGIRSDSDMYTLGYRFRPWTNPKAIADGASILDYLKQTAGQSGIDRKIRYRHRVERASWSSRDARWLVEARDESSEGLSRFTCRFLFACAGYYDYEEGYTPEFPGRERYRGQVVHPQHWTPEIAYAGKRVVVIGSGATAVTLVPALARSAAHVTMLQRSPSYIFSRPEHDAVADWLREHLPGTTAYAITRWKNVALSMLFFAWCRRFPESARRFLIREAKNQLNGASPSEHFTPSYHPWDQRLCLVPDGDLFQALRDRRATIVTDVIESFTESGLRLRSGKELEADLVVTATGLKLKLLGGLQLEVDGKAVEPSKAVAYKGIMLSEVPNLAMAIGYTNASWTLKCDLTSEYVCRLLDYMDAHRYVECRPRQRDPQMQTMPLIDFSSGYVQRAAGLLPSQGAAAPWRVYQNYLLDLLAIRHGKLDDGVLEFSRSAGPSQGP